MQGRKSSRWGGVGTRSENGVSPDKFTTYSRTTTFGFDYNLYALEWINLFNKRVGIHLVYGNIREPILER